MKQKPQPIRWWGGSVQAYALTVSLVASCMCFMACLIRYCTLADLQIFITPFCYWAGRSEIRKRCQHSQWSIDRRRYSRKTIFQTGNRKGAARLTIVAVAHSCRTDFVFGDSRLVAGHAAPPFPSRWCWLAFGFLPVAAYL